jgi:hypothetical protein
MANEEDIDDDIGTILRNCSFARENDRISIAQDGCEFFENIVSLSEKDVSSLAKGFAERTVTVGRLYLACVEPIS